VSFDPGSAESYIETLLVDEELADQLLLDWAGKCQF